jgi:hypothetical protein
MKRPRGAVVAALFVIWLAAQAVTTAAARPVRGRVPLSPPAAATVTAFVQHALVWRVLGMEGALAAANRALLEACRTPHDAQPTLRECAEQGILQGDSILARRLAQEAGVLAEVGHALGSLLLPNLGLRPTIHLALLVEDLTLCSEGLSSLLGEAAAAVPPLPTLPSPASSVDYGPRVQGLLTVLRRAEAWLAMIDHETGAHATLPGFAPGAPPIETQLGVP